MLVVGPSNSGKTIFVLRLIEHAKELFDHIPAHVYWFYGHATAQQDYLSKKNFILYHGLPENFDYCEPNSIIVLDDLLDLSGKHRGVTDLFTKSAHHKNLMVIFIQQNLLPQDPFARTRALNSQYIVLFKSPRDKLQIDVLGRQIYPSKKHYLIEIYENATKAPHSYLLIDLCQKTPELIRFRSNILPDEKPMYAYVDKHLFALDTR